MKGLLALGDAMDAVGVALDALGDTEERAALRRPLGGMMADLYIELQHPIIEQFPDLDPDKS
ncbi:hypothetical protein [Chenggangzhangella methanolivorans]|uniref:Uncharacterized protein n=1 Tax=Chenggangzhangella methanolivorans TaxID=1437009 RepID=A0A9E6R830_9HYPH|nr:hypothetical protein [Chenggangzhangella methanolivorans]QZN98362.1 hypothetical protein K6K41_14715 [Chenggangzhangella methanolivorans]